MGPQEKERKKEREGEKTGGPQDRRERVNFRHLPLGKPIWDLGFSPFSLSLSLLQHLPFSTKARHLSLAFF